MPLREGLPMRQPHPISPVGHLQASNPNLDTKFPENFGQFAKKNSMQ